MFLKYFLTIAFIACLFFHSSAILAQPQLPPPTVYPLVLVHGIAWRDDVWFLNYWGKIPKILGKHNFRVYLSGQQALASHVQNAVLLRRQILKVLQQSGAQKVNLIAHSKGGLECRYMISKLGMSDYVASLTTISTPHRGSMAADILVYRLQQFGWLKKFYRSANRFARLIGDTYPNAEQATENLTTTAMEHFNRVVPNHNNVYYQSYTSALKPSYPNGLSKAQYKMLHRYEGANDALVAVSSARWANFKGVISDTVPLGISHFDIIDIPLLSRNRHFSAPDFYVGLAHQLALMGF